MSGIESRVMNDRLPPSTRRNMPLWSLVAIVATGAIYFAVVEYDRHRALTPDEVRAKEAMEGADDM